MLRTFTLAGAAGAVLALSSFARPTPDEGMWLFNNAPARQLEERYGFEMTPAWSELVQKSCVRISVGGSGSIVSPNGLVMTNHHVASDLLERLSSADRNLLERGFFAASTEEELVCPDVHMDVLWSITDVTAEVDTSAAGLDAAAAGTARRKAMTAIEDSAKERSGMHAEVVTLYQGGRYHLYLYKRFDDIRLVFAPEKAIAFYGGDNDNFEFPRYCLDVTFLRIYEGGNPYQPEHYLRWSENGTKEGDLVFVAGHPGSTQRLNTVAHLEYLRDHSVPFAMHRLMRLEVLLNIFSGKSAEHRRIAEGDLFSVQNSRKVYVGRMAGLLDPAVMEAKRVEESRLRAVIAGNPEWQEQWGGAWYEIAVAQQTAANMARRYSAIGGSAMGLGSELAAYATMLVRLHEERPKTSTERLREFGEGSLPQIFQRLYSPAPLYPEFEVMRLESALSLMAELLGADDELVATALAGKSPRARAEECVLGSKLMDVAERRRLAEASADEFAASDDPLIELVRSLDPMARALRTKYEDEVQSVERAAYAKISAARFAVLGEMVYPDATFTLRLSYGAVAGYQDGDRSIPPYTVFAGVFAKAAERKGEDWYTLPASWTKVADSINGQTPFNFVSTNDIIGGNSGSPVIDRKGEVVGLIFDGNIQSLIGNYAFSDVQARSVSVDARGIMGALEQVYGADRIVNELRAPNTPR